MIRNVAIALIASGFIGGGAHAATLRVEGGQLIGASGVEVNGALFDVTFQDGSCASLYDGCKPELLTFSTQDGAIAASRALLDQVFVNTRDGRFDDDPSLTRGCFANLYCEILTMFDISDSLFAAGIAQNQDL